MPPVLLVLAGITISHKQVQRGTQLAAERGLTNVKFMVSQQQGVLSIVIC
jgi:hypothetical protein